MLINEKMDAEKAGGSGFWREVQDQEAPISMASEIQGIWGPG